MFFFFSFSHFKCTNSIPNINIKIHKIDNLTSDISVYACRTARRRPARLWECTRTLAVLWTLMHVQCNTNRWFLFYQHFFFQPCLLCSVCELHPVEPLSVIVLFLIQIYLQPAFVECSIYPWKPHGCIADRLTVWGFHFEGLERSRSGGSQEGSLSHLLNIKRAGVLLEQ